MKKLIRAMVEAGCNPSRKKTMTPRIERGLKEMQYTHIKSTLAMDPEGCFSDMEKEIREYYQKYANGVSDVDSFRTETRMIYDLMHHVYRYMFENDPGMKDVPADVRRETIEFLENMQFVRDHAMSSEPELMAVCTKRATAVRAFIEQKNREMDELVNTQRELVGTLRSIRDALDGTPQKKERRREQTVMAAEKRISDALDELLAEEAGNKRKRDA